jgi:hypothetical protein
MDELGVDVFIELVPRKDHDVSAAINEWLSKFKQHPSVKSLGIDLEYSRAA